MPLNEADTCRTYVLPKLYSAGWEDNQISEQKSFTDGRIVLVGNRAIRRPQKRADQLCIFLGGVEYAVKIGILYDIVINRDDALYPAPCQQLTSE